MPSILRVSINLNGDQAVAESLIGLPADIFAQPINLRSNVVFLLKVDDEQKFLQQLKSDFSDISNRAPGITGQIRVERGWLNPNDDFQVDDLIELIEIGK